MFDVHSSVSRLHSLSPEDLQKIFDESTKFQLYGYLSRYWACSYSHRTGVYINMKDNEVTEARSRRDRTVAKASSSHGHEGGYIIHVIT